MQNSAYYNSGKTHFAMYRTSGASTFKVETRPRASASPLLPCLQTTVTPCQDTRNSGKQTPLDVNISIAAKMIAYKENKTIQQCQLSPFSLTKLLQSSFIEGFHGASSERHQFGSRHIGNKTFALIADRESN